VVDVADEGGFLSRWSQRKVALAKGDVLAEPQAPLQPLAQPLPQAPAVQDAAQVRQDSTLPSATPAPAELPPPLTLDDVKLLTGDSDFAPFMARSVPPEVKNAAMKKLFTDPHYNVMDRLDIYIDDYSQPDPLPESMLRQMASAKFLKLFDEAEETEEAEKAEEAPPENRPENAISVPELSSPSEPQTGVHSQPTAQPSHTQDADPHLRLQPNHAAEPETPRDSAA